MWKKGAVEAPIGGRNVKKTRRIEDMCAAAGGRRGRRGQTHEHLFRPRIEAAIRGEVDETIGGIYHPVERDASRLKPTGKCRGREGAGVLCVGRHGRWHGASG